MPQYIINLILCSMMMQLSKTFSVDFFLFKINDLHVTFEVLLFTVLFMPFFKQFPLTVCSVPVGSLSSDD